MSTNLQITRQGIKTPQIDELLDKGKNDKLVFSKDKLVNWLECSYSDIAFKKCNGILYMYNDAKKMYERINETEPLCPIHSQLYIAGVYTATKVIDDIFEGLLRSKGARVDDMNVGLKEGFILFKNGVLNIKDTVFTTFLPPEMDIDNVNSNLVSDMLFTDRFEFDYVETDEPKCYDWLTHLSTSFDGDETKFNSLCSYFGYLFSGDNLHKALYLTGTGRNGKGVILKILDRLMPKGWVSKIPLSALCPNNNSSIHFTLNSLKDKMLNIDAETDTKTSINSTIIKQLIAQEPIDNVQMKYQNGYTLNPTAKFIFAGNGLPKFKGSAELGLYKRFIVIDFDRSFESKAGYFGKIEKEIPAIMSWICSYCIPLYKDKGLIECQNSDNILKDMRAQGSSAVEYFQNNVEVGKDTVGMSILYKDYQGYVEQNGRRQMSSRAFADEIKDLCTEQHIEFAVSDKQVKMNGQNERKWIAGVKLCNQVSMDPVGF